MTEMDYGIFMPVCNAGWIASVNAPQLPGTYAYNKQVLQLGESLGFDLSLAQSNWRGDGGATRHMDINLEASMTMAGLAEATESIGVWSTANTGMFHPAVMAKMMATADEISGGRSGLNIVAGGNPAADGSMGLWHGLDHPGRYRKAEEWVTVLKALWSEDSVDFDGEFYTLNGAQSFPKPVQQHPTLISAATSEDGIRFSARNLDAQLFEGMTRADVSATAERIRRISGEVGRPLKAYCVWMIIAGDTDADAQRRVQHFDEGRDIEALMNHIRNWSQDTAGGNEYVERVRAAAMESPSVSTGALIGSVDTVAEQLAASIDESQLDGVFFIMPDFIDDLRVIGEEIMPRLATMGFPGRTQAAMASSASPSPR